MIIIPCKALGSGKSRLAPALNGAERRALCEDFLRLSLKRACALATPAAVRLVTADPAAKGIAAAFDVRTINDDHLTLNDSLRAAADQVAAQDIRAAFVVMPIDLPLASIEALRKALTTEVDVLLVPDRKGEGTNLLTLSPAAVGRFPFFFGPNSFAHHLRAAKQLLLTTAILRDRDLGLDIDSPEDYREWRKRTSAVA